MNAPCDCCDQDDVPTSIFIGNNDQPFYLCPDCYELIEETPLP